MASPVPLSRFYSEQVAAGTLCTAFRLGLLPRRIKWVLFHRLGYLVMFLTGIKLVWDTVK